MQLTLIADNRNQRIGDMTLVEWIFDEASQVGIAGATVTAISERIDAEGKYYAASFVEVVEQPVLITVASEASRIAALFERLQQGGVRMSYMRSPIEYELPA